MSIMPGAVWRPITIPGGASKRTTKGRCVILHVAASEATSLYGFFNNNPNANSHFYVARDGTIEQMVDTDYQSWASMAANPSSISVETQGGVTNPDAEPWTAAQVASLGRICAWAHATEGVPLTPMPNSLPTSKGIGYHRLGIKPWVIAGGEIWSSSTGKVCPGNAKIAQIPAVIAAALGATPTPPEDIVTPQDIAAISDAVANRMVGPEGAAWQEWNTAAAQAKAAVAAVQALSAKVDALAAAVAKMPTGGGTMPAACAMQGAVLAPKPA